MQHYEKQSNVANDADFDGKVEVKIHVPNDVAMLRDLLLEKALNLTELHINFEHNWSETRDVNPVAHMFEELKEFELPKLNVLRVQNMIKNDYGIVADMLKAASNLNTFEKMCEKIDDGSLGPACIQVEDLTMLQSLNKLHCLQRVNLFFDEGLVAFLEKSLQFLNLPLKSIHLSMYKTFDPFCENAGMVNKILYASRNSLVELLVSSVGLMAVELPKFENLEKLTLSHSVFDARCMFPQNFDMVDSFPSLRELVVYIHGEDDYFSTYQPSSVMPNVEFLTIVGDCKYDEKLMKMTPNVKTLVLDGRACELPHINFRAIGSHLTRLENLKWLFHFESPDELQSSCALDAMITGLPVQFCKRMSLKLRNVDELSAHKTASYVAKRECYSLTDLKVDPNFSSPISNVTVPVGREAILTCIVHDLVAFKVAFLRVDTQTILTIQHHVITKNHRIGITHSDNRIWQLRIRDVKESDRGFYMCQINTDPMKSQIGYLDVVVPPDILDYQTSHDMTVQEGENVTLMCAATGSPSPSIEWRREKGKPLLSVESKEIFSVKGPRLILKQANRHHMGAYLCIASNGVPPSISKRVMLVVNFIPAIWIRQEVVYSAYGQKVLLECVTESHPNSVNFWLHNKQYVQGGTYESLTMENVFKVSMKLIVRPLDPSDFGEYKCVGKNALGESEKTVVLHHKSKMVSDTGSNQPASQIGNTINRSDWDDVENCTSTPAAFRLHLIIAILMVTFSL